VLTKRELDVCGRVGLLFDSAEGTKQEVAFLLAVRCGFRSHEIVDLSMFHITGADAETVVIVTTGSNSRCCEALILSALEK
jgi:hypothetical protein